MKKITIAFTLVLIMGLTSVAQEIAYYKKWYSGEYIPPVTSNNLRFTVRGRYIRPVKMEMLKDAKLLSDFISGYPTNWVINYTSVEIIGKSAGKEMKATSLNATLSADQKNILKNVDLGTNLIVNVEYKSKNPATDNIENYNVYVSMMVIPQTEAEYIGGEQQLTKYFNEKVINKIYDSTPKEFQKGTIVFTVNENGEIVNSKIFVTSGDSKTDKFLIDSINKMPKWKPAENSNGVKVKQEFEFILGTDGC